MTTPSPDLREDEDWPMYKDPALTPYTEQAQQFNNQLADLLRPALDTPEAIAPQRRRTGEPADQQPARARRFGPKKPIRRRGESARMPAQDLPKAAPAVPPSPPMRGRRALAVGAALTALGAVAAIAAALVNSPTGVSQFQRLAVSDRAGTITFTHTGDYLAYHESRAAARLGDQPEKVTASRVPLIPVTLTNQASGQQLELTTPYGNRPGGSKPKKLHYDYRGRGALAIWQFHISQTGRYQVQLSTSHPAPGPGAVVAFGPSVAPGARGIMVLWAGFVFLAGLITITVGLVRRHRAKRRPALTGAR